MNSGQKSLQKSVPNARSNYGNLLQIAVMGQRLDFNL